jgi:hypothetical protein
VPIVYTTSKPDQELLNGIVFCQVNSKLTGRRLVSLPFSDHCQPLVNSSEELEELLLALEKQRKSKHWKYIEIRPLSPDKILNENKINFNKSRQEYLHKLDLKPELNEVYRHFHKSCVQRKIKRAQRETLIYEEGRSQSLVNKFYDLLLMTRRRHQIPPQPKIWFQNLIDCLGDKLKIRVVSKNDQPIASIITLWYKNSLVYKYGCADSIFYNLGGMFLLFWQSIQEAKSLGATELDMGRSECSNTGLVTFKDRWGATRSILTYYRFPEKYSDNLNDGWKMRIAKSLFPLLPDNLLMLTGKMLYKHIG